MKPQPILPDVLQPGLKVVFCGTAASGQSASLRGYYAGPGNRFWSILHQIGLTPRLFQPGEYAAVIQYGIGLTNLAPYAVGVDSTLRPGDFDAAGLRTKIEKYAPGVLAFNGKRAAMETYGHGVAYGQQAERIGGCLVWVLPSTSGAARGFWDEAQWQALAATLQG